MAEVEIKLLRRIVNYGPKWVAGAIVKTDEKTAQALTYKGAAVLYDETQKKADAEHEAALKAVQAEKSAAEKARAATQDAKDKAEAEREAAAKRTPSQAEQRRAEVKRTQA